MKYTNLMNNQAGTLELQQEIAKALPGLLPSLKVVHALARRGGLSGLSAEVLLPSGNRRRLRFELQPSPTPGRIREPLRRFKAAGLRAGYPMLACRFVSPRVRDMCREEGVGYVDLAGNCFLQLDGLYVERIVERNPFPARGRPSSMFSPVSSRMSRALLEEPQREWTVSALAQATGMSLGQASNVARRLLEEEFARKAGRHLQLRHGARLLDAWRDAARPAPVSHGYYSLERDPQQRLLKVADASAAHQLSYAVTSFGAASLIAPFVHGIGTLVWYIEPAALELWVRALDLRPVEEGANVALLVPQDAGVFYRSRTVSGVTLVGDVQLYLDLSADPGRGREQAEFLRQQRLKELDAAG